MVLQKCHECGNHVSPNARKCPRCGAPVKKKKRKRGFVGFIGILLALGIVGIMLGECQGGSRKAEKIVKKTIEQEEKRKRIDNEETEKAEKEAFTEKIEEHYQRIVSAYKNKNYHEVENIFKLFEGNNSSRYKDVETINKKATIARLEKEVKPIPASQVEDNLKIYRKLASLDPTNPRYQKKVAFYSKKLEEKQRKNLKGTTSEINQRDKATIVKP